MPVIPGLAITIAASTSFFRITDVSFRTARTSLHKNVVNGQGARKSRHGARYNHPGVTTVYLAENLEATEAEWPGLVEDHQFPALVGKDGERESHIEITLRHPGPVGRDVPILQLQFISLNLRADQSAGREPEIVAAPPRPIFLTATSLQSGPPHFGNWRTLHR